MGRLRLPTRILLGCLAAAQLLLGQRQLSRDRVVEYALEGGLSVTSGLDAEAIARGYIEARAGRPDIEHTLDARSSSFGGAVEHLTFTPRIAGAPYFDSTLQVHVDREGRVVRFDAPRALPAPRDLVFPMHAARAAEAAVELTAGGATNRNEARTSAVAARVWFRAADGARAAWAVYVEVEGEPPRQIVLDATTEELLYERVLAQHLEPDGYVFPAPETQNPSEGAYELRSLSGWTDGAATVGNNVDACADVDGDDICDGRALGVSGRFPYPFADAYASSLDPAPDRPAALVNAFYWANVAHDWLYDLGFDEASGNFQQDNFGRGGYGGDRLRLDVHDGGTTNNAWFSTPPDGIAPRMQLGLWPGSRRDGAFDGDIILHEYVHGLTNRLVGGPLDAGGLFLWQSGAMGEGWSDALSASFTDDPVIGEYSSGNPTTGIRAVRFDQSSLTFGQFGLRRITLLPGTTVLAGLPAVHRDGEIWASTLWDLRQALGAAAFEQTALAAMKLTPRRPSMLDGRDAFLQAAGLSGLSSGNICRLWDVFAARGMGASAALNPVGPGEWADSALSVYESFDIPASCGGAAPVFDSVAHQEGAESASGWTATGLWHRTARRVSSGAQSWWFGREQTGTYDTGARVSGTLTSPLIDLARREGAVLEWRQVFRGEGFLRPADLGGELDPYLNLDSGRLWVSTDAGASWSVLSHIAHETPGTGFARFRVNLSRFAGQVIRLRFEMDTFNASNNTHEGWYLDDIQVRTTTPTANMAVAAEWPFDAGFQDKSGNGFDPLEGGGAAVPGIRGNALRIADVSDALRIPVDERLNAASFTARVWVRLTRTPRDWGDLISNYGNGFAGWRLGVTNAGKPFFAVASKPSNLVSIIGPASLEPGRWTELVAVYDGLLQAMRLYVDGALASEEFGVEMTPRTDGVMTIGCAAWTNTNPVYADVDEALVAPRAWSAAEAAQDFDSFSLPAAE